MTVPLTDPAVSSGAAGPKARSLADLTSAGFDVPDGFVVTGDALADVLAHTGCREQVEEALRTLTRENLGSVARRLRGITARLVAPPELAAQLAQRVGESSGSPGGLWAVRSSGALEDSGDLSYAGQYLTRLEVPADEVLEAVLDVYRSTWGEAALAYLVDHGASATATGFAVIVQQMVPADVSGVAFGIDPVSGADTEIVIEAAPGLGEDLVAGRVHASRTVHDWYADRTLETGTLLSAAERRAVAAMVLDVQRHYGYPCDVEWAIADGRLRVLQARPITRVHHAGSDDQWSNADFKDGGVSATVCSRYMWSLYDYIWDRHLRAFMLESRLLEPGRIGPLGRMYCGRPYWNLSVVKSAMAAVPGYVERRFDAELGVRIAYEGDGETTGLTPRTLLRIARVAVRQHRMVTRQRESVEGVRDSLLAVADSYQRWLEAPAPAASEVKATWRRLVYDDYDRSEGTYFRQIFLNTIHLALAKDAVAKLVGEEGYFALISGLDHVSHLRPFYDAWRLSRTIRGDAEALAYWTGNPVSRIAADLDAGCAAHRLDGVRDLVERYGYHSVRELDVTHPDFDEDHAAVVTMVHDTVGLDDAHAPDADRARLRAAFEAALARALRAAGPLRAGSLRRRIERSRQLLWWREELRDTSTRFYHLIRLTTLRLAAVLVSDGTLQRRDDVWFCSIDELARHLDGWPAAELRRAVARNRAYYESFRNYRPPNEFGRRLGEGPGGGAAPRPGSAEPGLTGVAASPGVVEGTARVISGLDDIDRLQPDDILVTRFTDTGWTGKFALISGIVTEYGGILTHAAIVSREYGIPCVVACHDVMTAIPDGARVRLDGTTGRVILL